MTAATYSIELHTPTDTLYIEPYCAIAENFLRLSASSIDESNMYKLTLIVSEAVTNAVKYAQSPNGMKMICKIRNDELEMVFVDYGDGFNINAADEDASGDVRDRGYGLAVIKQIADSVEYISGSSGNCLIVTTALKRRIYADKC